MRAKDAGGPAMQVEKNGVLMRPPRREMSKNVRVLDCLSKAGNGESGGGRGWREYMGVNEAKRQTLAALEGAPPMFVLPRDDLLPTLVPAIAASSVLDCMMGFFASSSLAEIAPGLAAFLAA